MPRFIQIAVAEPNCVYQTGIFAVDDCGVVYHFEGTDGWVAFPNNVYPERDALLEELQRLKDWKESAMRIITDWQEIGRALGLGPGDSIDKALPAILELKRLKSLSMKDGE